MLQNVCIGVLHDKYSFVTSKDTTAITEIPRHEKFQAPPDRSCIQWKTHGPQEIVLQRSGLRKGEGQAECSEGWRGRCGFYTCFFATVFVWPTSCRNSGPRTRTASDLCSMSRSTVVVALTVNLHESRPANAASPMCIVGPKRATSYGNMLTNLLCTFLDLRSCHR